MKTDHVGILGTGIYLPNKKMTAKQIALKTNGVWSEEAVISKLGIRRKYVPKSLPNDGSQEMGALAAIDALKNTGMDPLKIDLILCVTEEWKEFPLTTSALYVQGRIGAENAWGIDVQNRCCTTCSAIKMAKDMMLGDDELNVVLICGGYRNGDFVDYTDKNMSMMYNLGAGGGAIILVKNLGRNEVLGSHIIGDGTLARAAGVRIGGQVDPITSKNLKASRHSLCLMDPIGMKDRLNAVSMPNWYKCIDESLRKSGLSRNDLGYLAILHIKRSGHDLMIQELGLRQEQTVYLEDYGHIGQIDQILSIHLGLKKKKIKEGTIVCTLAAGIGYVWAANIIRWGGGISSVIRSSN